MMLAALLLAHAATQAAAESRLAELDRTARAQEIKLAAERAPLAPLLATAQRLALRPPALALARPGSAEEMARTRALIAALGPEIKRRTAALRHQMLVTESLRAQAEQALAKSVEASESLLAASPQARARLAALPAPSLPPARQPTGIYRLPVRGNLVVGMGERSSIGVRARGITLATAGGAPVTAPATAYVAYAGRFRGYGDIVILDHGHGWATILAGLDHVTAETGTLVQAGRQIGQMGQDGPRLTVELRHGGKPVDVAAMVLQ